MPVLPIRPSRASGESAVRRVRYVTRHERLRYALPRRLRATRAGSSASHSDPTERRAHHEIAAEHQLRGPGASDQARTQRGARHGSNAVSRQDQSEDGGFVCQLPRDVDRDGRHQGRHDDACRAPVQDRVPERGMGGDVVDPLADLGDQGPDRAIDRRTKVAPHEDQAERRDAERERVDREGRAWTDRRGQDAGDRWADDVAEGVDRLEHGVRAPDLAPSRRAPAVTRSSLQKKKDRRMASGAATSRMTASVGPPSATDSGISAVMTARPRSARNIIRLRSLRSAMAPASIPKTRSGSVWSAPTTPMANPDPVSARTSSGIAVNVTASPTAVMPWLVRRTLKSRFRPSGTGIGSWGTPPMVGKPHSAARWARP